MKLIEPEVNQETKFRGPKCCVEYFPPVFAEVRTKNINKHNFSAKTSVRFQFYNKIHQNTLILLNPKMSESASARHATPKVKKPAKSAEHPPYTEMVLAAITALKERNGSSRQAIAKYIKGNYKVGDNCDSHLKLALKRMSEKGTLLHTKGTGASGSFKVNKAVVEKKAEKKPKKPAAKKPAAKPKKPVAKKVTKAAKPSTKTNKTKSPAKNKSSVKKPAAKKATKPKPAKKSATKKTAKKAIKKATKSPKK